MDNENKTPELNNDDHWLEDILGTDTPKASMSYQDLAASLESASKEPIDPDIDPRELELENILAENWDESQPAEEIADDSTMVLPQIQQHPEWEDPMIAFSDATIAIPVLSESQQELPEEMIPEQPPVIEPPHISPEWEDPELKEMISEVMADELPEEEFPFPQVTADELPEEELPLPQVMDQEPEQEPVIPEIIVEEPVVEEPVAEEPAAEEPQPEMPVEPEPAPVAAQEPEVVPEEKPVTEKQPGNKRPKNKNGFSIRDIPSIFSTMILGLLIMIIGVSAGHTLWLCCSDVMGFGKPSQELTVTITSKDDIDTISQKLHNAGLIEQPKLFKLFATLTGKDEDISTGTFTLNRYYDYNAMINAMGRYAPAREVVTVTIPEGYTCAQIYALLESYEVCSVTALEEYAASGELDEYWFLENVDRDSKYCLEGYLFPDTYEFYTNDDPENVLEKMLDTFDYRFNDKMQEDFLKIQEKYGEDFTVNDLVILASMVERETASNAESFRIASVYYNRLANPSKFPRLECDATVHYAIGDYFGEIHELTAEHLAYDSPYNTRLNSGMPPGPISNPGINSLNAVMYPDDEDFFFYVFNPETGSHEFSKTIEEHNRKSKELGY